MLSPAAAATHRRIQERRFTESDVRTTFIEMRDKLGPITREIGDLIAHPDRDRGKTFDFLIRGHSQTAMFAKYKGDKKIPFPIDGSCDWWLKRHLLEQTKMFTHKKLKKALKVGHKGLRREIKGYFSNDDFPTNLSKNMDQRFIDIVNFLGTLMGGDSAFDYSAMRLEMASLLEKIDLEIDDQLIDDLIVCMCILFHNAEFSLPSNNSGSCEMHVKTRMGETFEREGQSYVIPTAHGEFQVSAASPVAYLDGSVTFRFSLISTDIQTDNYVDPKLISNGEHGLPSMDLKQNLQFDRTKEFPVGLA